MRPNMQQIFDELYIYICVCVCVCVCVLNFVCAFGWYSKYIIARPIYFSSKSVDFLQQQMAVFRPNTLKVPAI